MGRLASIHAEETILLKRDWSMLAEQEKVARTPPGRRSFMARRLMSLYPLAAVDMVAVEAENLGGSRMMTSNLGFEGSSSNSRRYSKTLALRFVHFSGVFVKPLSSKFFCASSKASSLESTLMTDLAPA